MGRKWNLELASNAPDESALCSSRCEEMVMGARNDRLPTRVSFRDVEEDEFRAADPAAAALPQRIGGFSIVRRLGVGGMGTVYEAKQDRPDRAVALKVMRNGLGSKQLEGRFEREAEVLARLSHPNIAKVYSAGTHIPGPGAEIYGPVPFIALEFVRGAQPITKFAADRNLSRVERVSLFLKVCDAVHYGHECGVLHRDLKPDNLLVDEVGEPKVIDFGVARVMGGKHESGVFRTEMGQILGTVQYMSPEQCAADPSQVDARSDVYSLGVVLYELLTSALPYDVRDTPVYEAIKCVQESSPKTPSSHDPTLDRDLEIIIETAIAKAREQRYASARALSEDLARWIQGEPIAARPQSRVQKLRRFARRNRALTLLAGALVLVTISSAGAIAALHSRVKSEHVARVEAERNAGSIARDAEELREQIRALASLDAPRRAVWMLRDGSPSETAEVKRFDRELAKARASLEELDKDQGDDIRVSVVVADSYEMVGDMLASRQPADAAAPKRAWTRSLEIQRATLKKHGDDVIAALCPKDRSRMLVPSACIGGASVIDRTSGFVWRLPQREGELLLKLGHLDEAKTSLRAAYELCARAYANAPGDADIEGDLAAIARSLARLFTRSKESDLAARYASIAANAANPELGLGAIAIDVPEREAEPPTEIAGPATLTSPSPVEPDR